MGVIEGILATGLGKLAAVLSSGLVLGLVVKLGRKPVQRLVAGYLGRQLVLVLDPKTSDPVLREKIQKAARANVELAEYMIPDRGRGAEKRAVVAAMLRRILPAAPADAIASLIEEAWESSDDVLKGTLKP